MSVTFDEAPPEGHINFGVGQPSPDLLPVALMREAAAHFLDSAEPLELNYGEKQGDRRFRATLAAFLTRHYGTATDADELFVSGGNSQALDLVCARFTQPGDTVFVEEPTYFLAHQILRDHGLNIVGIPVDGGGLDTAALEAALQTTRPALLYTIPSFHNPLGVTLTAARRDRVLALSREYGFLVCADEVYQLLYYDTPPPAAFGSRIREPEAGTTVLSMGSFSKILAPGLRLGWIQTGSALMQGLLASGAVRSGGSLNHFTSHVVRHALDLGLQEQHLEALRSAYGARVEAMDRALRAHLGDLAQWEVPGGGYFFWLELAPGVDTRPLRAQALAQATGFQPGTVFSCQGRFGNCLRLSFAHYGPAEIETGVARLAGVLRAGLAAGRR